MTMEEVRGIENMKPWTSVPFGNANDDDVYKGEGGSLQPTIFI